MGTVYLIHFDQKLAHAEHYIGFTKSDSPKRRLAVHRANNGARILQVLNAQGIGYHVARVWRKVGRDFERRLKNRKGPRCLCPQCTPAQKPKRYRLWRH